MSDIAQDAARISASPRGTVRLRPFTPYVCAFVAASVGVVAGQAMGGDASAFEHPLLLLLRFMAAMKFAGVLVAAGLLHWRLTGQISPPLATAYGAALIAMALASGLIWSLGGIVLGAVLFHVGLIAFLVLAWRDEDVQLPRRRR